MPKHGKRSTEHVAEGQVHDDQWELHREYAADVYGNIASITDIGVDGPRLKFTILRDKIRRRKQLDACRTMLAPLLDSDWDAVLARHGVTEEEELLLRLFICTDEAGRVERGKNGWPVSIGYRPLAREAHLVDPARWVNGKGEAPYPNAVKEPVLRGFCEKAYGYWQEVEPGLWSRQQIATVAEYFFGDPRRRVSHRKNAK